MADKREPWRAVWQDGIAPLLIREQLEALQTALARDDPALVQWTTAEGRYDPAAPMKASTWDCSGACAISYCGWQGDRLRTVGEVEDFFARMCYAIDDRLSESGACRYFIGWFDDNPREYVRKELLAEVTLALTRKADE